VPGGVGEVAYGDAHSRKGVVLKVDGGAAGRTEMEGKRTAAFARPHPRGRFTVDGDLIATESSLVAHCRAGAALALQAMAHGDL
jgi:hypothetical protein